MNSKTPNFAILATCIRSVDDFFSINLCTILVKPKNFRISNFGLHGLERSGLRLHDKVSATYTWNQISVSKITVLTTWLDDTTRMTYE